MYLYSVEFVATGRSHLKKIATSMCSVSMVRQLYAAKLIEKVGETKVKIARDVNMKRKAEAEVSI